jgi:hypothetical protein
VVPVKKVRGSVSLIERLRMLSNPSRLRRWRFSRIRSKMTMVSLSE